MATRDEDQDEDQPQGGQQAAAGTESGLRPVVPGAIQEDDEEFDIVETDDEGKEIGRAAPAAREPAREESRLSEEEAGDQPVIREGGERDGQQQRREPRSARNARRREARDRTSQENSELRARLEALEGRVGSQVEPRLLELGENQIRTQAERLDNAIAESEAAQRSARAAIADAMQNSDTPALNDALDRRDAALIRTTQLKNEKTRVDAALAEVRRAPAGDADGGRQQADGRQQQDGGRQERQQPKPLPARVQRYVNDFAQSHDWYDPSGRNPDDVDSQTVLAIDRAVAQAGFDPGSQDYWDEMEDRMREKLPWHFKEGGRQQDGGRQERQPSNGRQTQQTPAQQQRRGPPTSGNSDRGNGGGNRKSVTISPARKEAMIQAGAINDRGQILDKPKYSRLLRSYDEFDRTNPVR